MIIKTLLLVSLCLIIQFVSCMKLPLREEPLSGNQVLGLREVIYELEKHGLLRVPRRTEPQSSRYTPPVIEPVNTDSEPSNSLPSPSPRINPFLSTSSSPSKGPEEQSFIPQPEASVSLPATESPPPSLPRNPFLSSSSPKSNPRSIPPVQSQETKVTQQQSASSNVPSSTTLSRVQTDPPVIKYSAGNEKYATTYEVTSDADKLNFGHSEVREGSYIAGEYFVLQPDGRTRRVTYVVDGDKGFIPFIEYEGQATSPTTYGLNR